MIKRFRKLFIPIILCCCLLAIGLLIVVTNKPQSAQAIEAEAVTTPSVMSAYAYGSVFEIPSGKISYRGEEYSADSAYLITPDGAVHTESSYVLKKLGQYTVEYRATVGISGKKVALKAYKHFSVTGSKYVVSTDASQVSYGEFKSFVPKTDAERKEGLIVSLAEGETFSWLEPLSLENGLNSIIKFYVDQTYQELAAGMITVTLTDCYDPSVYISFNVDASYSQYIYYATASAYGKNNVGLEKTELDKTYSRTIVNVDGTDYIKYVDEYGLPIVGMGNRQYETEWRFNTTDNKVYVMRQGTSRGNFVSDLDNKDLYDKLFEGFTTGEVYLSVSASDYRKASVTIEIEEIFAQRGGALLSSYVDDIKPVVYTETDLSGYDKIFIAKDESVKIFSAYAYDVNLIGDVKSVVYFNYKKAGQTAVLIDNGSFTATKSGVYCVVYTAKDSYGNVGQLVVEYNAVDTDGEPTVKLTLDGNLSGSYEAGGRIALPTYSLDGLNGTTSTYINAKAVHESGRIFDIDVEANEFIPLYTGKYDIVYSYGDIVTSYELKKEITVVSSDTNVLFQTAPTVERYYIKGASYSMEKVYASTFRGDAPKLQLAEIAVRFDGVGDFIKASYASIEITGDDFVQFRYTYGGVSEFSDEIPIVDVGYGDRTKFTVPKYFSGDFQYVLTNDGEEKNSSNRYLGFLRYTAKATGAQDGVLKMDYINAISLSSFKFEFSFIEGMGNFEKFSVILTDYYDGSNSVNIDWRELNGNILFKVGDMTEESIGYGFRDEEAYQSKRMISFAPSGSRFIESSGEGHEFAYNCGFTTDKCYLSVVFEGVTGDCGLDVYSLCGQSLYSSMTSDESAPIVYVSGIGGTYSLNQNITVPIPTVTDVLSPVLGANITVTLRDGSGDYLTAADGTSLNRAATDKEYVITLSSRGSYQLLYIAVDGYGVQTQKLITFKVDDITPPTITLSGVADGEKVTAKQGDVITLAKYDVSDDVTTNCSVTVVVFSPQSTAIARNASTFVAEQKGTYKVCYQAYDEAGNYTLVSYYIVVS